jgi:hypothetical protein
VATVIADRPMTTRRPTIPYGLALTAVIAFGAVLLWLFFAADVAQWRFGDPDDIMRLQEVRDWLGGQSWFDVTQYRINPPSGLKMHWSRLLDVPLGAVILTLRPFLGETEAERAACVVVPLVTYAAIALLTAAIARRTLQSRPLALVAAGFCATNIAIIQLARPMRIDHHGWQAVCALGMVWTLLTPRTARHAAVAGLCAALWMHISLEGIVFTAGCGAWLGFQWLSRPTTEGMTLPAFMAATAAGSLAFFLIGHGGGLFDRTFCDAISPVHMVVFSIAAIGSALAVRLSPASLPVRAMMLGATALACAATYRLWAPQCGGGPFSSLTPLTYRLWYETISEGLPIWRQPLATGIGWLAFPLTATFGAINDIRTASPERRGIAIDYAVLLLLATIISVFVSRAGALSNILAVPGGLMLLRSALARSGSIPLMPVRVLASALACSVLIPLAPPMLAIMLFQSRSAAGPRGDLCALPANLAHMNALPATVVMTTLDLSQALIFASHHKAVSAGYHRNVASMDDTLRFFTGDDTTAHAMLARHDVGYVLVCPGDGDATILAKAVPGGLADRLPRGDAPAWLRPVRVPGLRYARVYAVSR